MELWTYGGGSNEQWMPASLGGNPINSLVLGGHRCLDVPGASTAPGFNIQLQIYDCNGTDGTDGTVVSTKQTERTALGAVLSV